MLNRYFRQKMICQRSDSCSNFSRAVVGELQVGFGRVKVKPANATYRGTADN